VSDARLIEQTIARIEPPDGAAAAAARRALDAKTKPRGSLGRLEDVACTIAAVRRTADLGELRTAVVVAAADHGVAAEGVSAYPPAVTAQMLENFRSGGAAVCVLARLAGAELRIFDLGVGTGTANIAHGPGMTPAAAERAVARGIEAAGELADEGFDVVALGEMGIANTTAASALAARLLPAEPAAVCGRGTGLDDAGLRRKVEVVGRALRVNEPAGSEPLEALAALGGFEIAFLTGLTLGAAARALVVLLDGFITSTAALVAARLAPLSTQSMLAAHLSPEPGHALVLDELALTPLLDLRLRLGEGSGAALALPIVQAAVAILRDMSTFEEAGVIDSGR
jgi:nicotinate-nucleotide--dimethylbenzimidazole phosphoribosyltransferase